MPTCRGAKVEENSIFKDRQAIYPHVFRLCFCMPVMALLHKSRIVQVKLKGARFFVPIGEQFIHNVWSEFYFPAFYAAIGLNGDFRTSQMDRVHFNKDLCAFGFFFEILVNDI